eukprot:659971-Pelagomonas_calceolata.AAC.6
MAMCGGQGRMDPWRLKTLRVLPQCCGMGVPSSAPPISLWTCCAPGTLTSQRLALRTWWVTCWCSDFTAFGTEHLWVTYAQSDCAAFGTKDLVGNM